MKQHILMLVAIIGGPILLPAQLTLQNGALLNTGGNAVIVLQNIDLVINGNISQKAGDGRFIFSGAVSSAISGLATPVFDVIELSKTGAANVTLYQSVNIVSGITFSTGLLDLNNNDIFLQPTALLNGENENSRITGLNGGHVEITTDLDAPTAGNPGNLGAVITSSKNLGSTTIRRGHVSQMNSMATGSSIYRYFDILPSNDNNLNATLRLNYFDAELNNLDENSLNLWKSADEINWTNEGFISRDVTANYVEQSGLSDLSRWTLSSIDNPLPVNFISFNISCISAGVLLTWETALEENTSHFYVQSSTDGIHFFNIGEVAAAGNSSTTKTYQFSDSLKNGNVIFYRIAETDLDGRMQYTSIRDIQCNEGIVGVKYWPNPVTQTLNIMLSDGSSSPVNIKIIDSKGLIVLQQNKLLATGNDLITIRMDAFSAGYYNLLLNWNNGQNQKVINLIKK